jgi:hypothetical protein
MGDSPNLKRGICARAMDALGCSQTGGFPQIVLESSADLECGSLLPLAQEG